MAIAESLSRRCFGYVHGNNLVYNTCWEDPRLDREALALGPNDRLMMITSAGCNALDYLLAGAGQVHCVDLNPRQNALLELKVAGIRRLEFEDFFCMFGQGNWEPAAAAYRDVLRSELSPTSRRYWDRHIEFFNGQGRRRSFYFRGTSGYFAWLMNVYIDRVSKLRPCVEAMLAADGVREQQAIYASLKPRLWRGFVRWLIRRDSTLALLGVPRLQRQQLERDHQGGIAHFVENCVESVFTQIPMADNYFWRVYLTGSYSPTCCPEYLKPDNFQRLRAGLVDRLSVHTASVRDFLEQHSEPLTRFVLLDHMDWFGHHDQPLLARQWQALLGRAAPGARVLWRSGGTRCDHVDRLPIEWRGRSRPLGELLH
ncbi:MAG TPA: BtaA family protein, partial [Pirellulales bacterium]|nr:BtaA family protein [Pirellulales bacterium]